MNNKSGILELLLQRELAEKLILERIGATPETLEKMREDQHRAIFARFLMYFKAMSFEIRNECLVQLMDVHIPEIGEGIDTNA